MALHRARAVAAAVLGVQVAEALVLVAALAGPEQPRIRSPVMGALRPVKAAAAAAVAGED